MKDKAKQKTAKNVKFAFWDTSAIVPLCCRQAFSQQIRRAARQYPGQAVWWGTPVEALSSLNRLVREGYLSSGELRQALQRLDYLRRKWDEIQPTLLVRNTAERMLGAHNLRAADALQLAAALIWCRNFSRQRTFICVDNRLAEAAEAEGFTVIQPL
jgi:predicted nucleic acid-binding protein